MKIISLHQPYATRIADGHKQYETRSWSTRHRGLIAIHAAKNTSSLTDVQKKLRVYPLGAIVAVAHLCGVYTTESLKRFMSAQEQEFGDWARGRFAWRLEAVCNLPFPVPCRGFQGIWNLDPAIEALVWAQLKGGSE